MPAGRELPAVIKNRNYPQPVKHPKPTALGLSLPFATLSSGLSMSPLVIILDGYDELLQATGLVFADYLERVREFQESQALHRRPVRIIITSRLTLIDRAIVPDGTTIVRLEEFDQKRCAAWSDVWNQCNATYFQHTGTRPFTLPRSEKILDLAKQPLLLLMLAIYDSTGNELGRDTGSHQADIDQTLLYDRLLRRFIERELSKPDRGRKFRELNNAQRVDAVSREMDRLGVAAVSMFNRLDVKIRQEELSDDLRYFGMEPETVQAGRVLSPAELLLGRFFFVHKSTIQLTESSTVPNLAPTAFEFLHNTFGEFLAADFILRRVTEEARTICELSASKQLAEQRNRHLSTLTEAWLGCLIQTPLYTRPVILSMLWEWSRHRLGASDWSRKALLAALDEIVGAQLRVILNDLTLPNPDPDRRTRSHYPRLPKRGHLAVYSLNLVLLRTYVGDDEYLVDETGLADPADGCCPWDSLVNLWRSWFPLESLDALASSITASRQDTQIVVRLAKPAWATLDATKLSTAFRVSEALADNFTAAVTGLHVASLNEMTAYTFERIRKLAISEVPELIRAT
jgi:hypothetical protein